VPARSVRSSECGPRRDQIRKRFARSGANKRRVCGGSRCHSNGATPHPPLAVEAHYGSNQWLATSDHNRSPQRGDGTPPNTPHRSAHKCQSHCLIPLTRRGASNCLATRATSARRKWFAFIMTAIIVGHAQSHATLCLPGDERPVRDRAVHPARLSWVIDRELDVVEGAQFRCLLEHHAVAVGSDGELDGLCAQVGQHCLKSGCMPFSPVPRFTERTGSFP